MAKKIRVHELAKNLGMTNAETVELAKEMGYTQVKTHSSSLEEHYADNLRRRAERDGLTRDEQPEDASSKKSAAKSTKKSTSKKSTGKKTKQSTKQSTSKKSTEKAAAPEKPATADDEGQVKADQAKADQADATKTAASTSAADAAVADTPVADTPAAPDTGADEDAAPAKAEAPAEAPPAETSGAKAADQSDTESGASAAATPAPAAAEQAPAPPTAAATSAEPAEGGPVISSAGPEEAKVAAAKAEAEAKAAKAAEAKQAQAEKSKAEPAKPAAAGAPSVTSRPKPPTGPLSPSGKPVPPPPGVPVSSSGKPIPPPPGRANPDGNRSPGGSRPGGYSRPGGGGGPRPGGGGGPRPGGGGGRPSGGRRPPRRSKRRRRRDREELKPQEQSYTPADAPVPDGTIVVERGVSAQEFGPKLNRTAADVVKFLMNQGEMIAATMALADDHMELYALELGADVLLVDPGQQQEIELQALFDDTDDDDEDLLQPRAPIITVMGHVDHGKTTLLDRIRSANVVDGEAGGITQHIGAYQVEKDGKMLTFLDTPGHAAFSQMRARGADVTDIVVLVVAADDGVMPQTEEAISHAKSAEVPIIVAVNKIDKDNANPERVLSELSERELVPEAWGGDTIVVEVSALENLGIEDLLENLNVVAELEGLDANPTGRAKGVVLEAVLDRGRGPVATILVDKGELHVGDPIVAGHAWGRVRAMVNDRGEQITAAGPSTPVEVLGLSDVPEAGDEFRVAPDEKIARTVGEAREHHRRVRDQRGDARVKSGVKLEDIFDQIQAGESATLNLILKADVQGSLEAVTESLKRLQTAEVDLTFVHRAVGGISENDITLAATTNATIIGFNTRPDRKAREAAETESVEIRTYEIIYKLLEDVEQAMLGMLAPEFEEIVTGEAEVREIFRIPRIGAIAGCYVTDGVITRNSKVRFLRDGTIIWKGSVDSLKRFKEDVPEVRAGFECGIGLSDFQDLKQGDIIETFDEREVERTL